MRWPPGIMNNIDVKGFRFIIKIRNPIFVEYLLLQEGHSPDWEYIRPLPEYAAGQYHRVL